jgi:hypothetical protein
MAPTTSLFINPSLLMSAGDGGAAGAVAMATASGKKQQKKALGSPKISNNFEPVGRRNVPRLAKAGGGVSEPEAAGSTPKKWPQEGTPRKKARGKETFVFRVNRKKAKAAKIAMVDAAHVDLPVAVRGAKRGDAGDLADPNDQAGHSPPEATACGILAKGGCGTPVNEGGSNKEKAGGSVSKPEAAGSMPKKTSPGGDPPEEGARQRDLRLPRRPREG